MYHDNKLNGLIGNPVGISFKNGQGTSGVLCNVSGGEIYIIEYLYQKQFAMKHYHMGTIRNIYPFPPCPRSPRPHPRPVY